MDYSSFNDYRYILYGRSSEHLPCLYVNTLEDSQERLERKLRGYKSMLNTLLTIGVVYLIMAGVLFLVVFGLCIAMFIKIFKRF